MVRWSAEALIAAGARELIVVVGAGDEPRAAEALAGLPRWRTTAGGATRSQSVKAGLAALGVDDDAIVLVHDAARPLLPLSAVKRLLAAGPCAVATLGGGHDLAAEVKRQAPEAEYLRVELSRYIAVDES